MKGFHNYGKLATGLLAAVLMISGCEVGETPSLNGRIMIQGTFEQVTDLNAKSALHDDGHVYWTPGDAISLFYGSGTDGGSKFVAELESDDRVASFSGVISAVTGLSDDSADDLMFWGLYPYDPEAICDGQSITTGILRYQMGRAGTFAPGMAPSLGRAPGLLLPFRNLYSGIWFTVTRDGYRRFTFRSNNGEPVSGRCSVGFGEDGLPYIKQVLKGTDAVTVLAPDGGTFVPDKRYYAILIPQSLSGGFTVTLESDTEVGTYVIDRSVNFLRNKISKVENLDTKATFDVLDEQPANEIWYTTTSGSILDHVSEEAIGAGVLMHYYKDGKGVIIFDKALDVIGASAFAGCGLTAVSLPEGIVEISDQAFANNPLTGVEIPSSVTSLGRGAFSGCTGLAEVVCLAVNPPSCDAPFVDCSALSHIYVPAASVEAYKAAPGWSEYAALIGVATQQSFGFSILTWGSSGNISGTAE